MCYFSVPFIFLSSIYKHISHTQGPKDALFSCRFVLICEWLLYLFKYLSVLYLSSSVQTPPAIGMKWSLDDGGESSGMVTKRTRRKLLGQDFWSCLFERHECLFSIGFDVYNRALYYTICYILSWRVSLHPFICSAFLLIVCDFILHLKCKMAAAVY